MNPDDLKNHFRYSYECNPIENLGPEGIQYWRMRVTGTVEAYGQTLTFYREKDFNEAQLFVHKVVRGDFVSGGLVGFAAAITYIAEQQTQAVRDKLAEKVMIARMKHHGRGKSKKYYNRTVRW